MEFHHRKTKKCTLLSLPAELRTKIYFHLLGGHTIHIGGTGHQPYTDEHLDNGRCSSCTAKLSDEDCHAKYTQRGKAFKGTLNADRFAARHRDCYRYPVRRVLHLDILSTCKQIHSEAAKVPFEENVFTLARPHSFPLFLERLAPFQIRWLRNVTVYSVASVSTWIGPVFTDQDFDSYLTGLRTLRIFVELKQSDVQFDTLQTEYSRKRWRLSGVEVFKLKALREVELLVVTPDWHEMEQEELNERTLEGLQEWEASVRQMLLPLSPLQRLIGA